MAYVVALDSSLAVIPGNSDWEHRVIQLTALHQLALGRMEGGLRRLDRLLRDAPPTALVQVPPRLRGPLIRTMWTMQYAEAGQARPEDLAALESAASQIPLASSVLHFAYLQRGDVDRAGRFAFDSGPLAPDVDTTAIALAFRGWERLIRGDTAAALQSIEEGVRRIGYLDIELINPVIFPYAVALSLDPGTRERGIRMLRWMVTYRATDTGAAYLALGRAHEAAGQDEQARGAYGQVLRLWEGAGAFRQDEVDEARRALIRLTGEG